MTRQFSAALRLRWNGLPKGDAPPEVHEILRQEEAQADECWRGLQIRYRPSNLAVWAVLTGGVRMVEREQAARGSNTPHFDAMLANLSRLLAVAVKWAMGHGQPAATLNRRWTGEIAVIAMFVAERDEVVAERYVLHGAVESRKAARQHREFAARIAEPPLTDEEMAALENRVSALLQRFGKPFGNDYGWAADPLAKENPSFADIERAVNVDHWRPYYRLPSIVIGTIARLRQ